MKLEVKAGVRVKGERSVDLVCSPGTACVTGLPLGWLTLDSEQTSTEGQLQAWDGDGDGDEAGDDTA